jgi:5-formyltetrahydrofolate cyclo-ligase
MESADKAALRQQVTSNRPQSSQGLTQNLIRLALELDARVIASYWPMANEPDTSEFNNWVELIGKTLITPRLIGQDLEFAGGATTSGSFGIQEPGGEAVPLSTADLILVPALAVDASGQRLGKGQGYYDRALEGIQTSSCYAVVFESEIFDRIPTESHDFPVNGAVTPSAIRNFIHG